MQPANKRYVIRYLILRKTDRLGLKGHLTQNMFLIYLQWCLLMQTAQWEFTLLTQCVRNQITLANLQKNLLLCFGPLSSKTSRIIKQNKVFWDRNIAINSTASWPCVRELLILESRCNPGTICTGRHHER